MKTKTNENDWSSVFISSKSSIQQNLEFFIINFQFCHHGNHKNPKIGLPVHHKALANKIMILNFWKTVLETSLKKSRRKPQKPKLGHSLTTKSPNFCNSKPLPHGTAALTSSHSEIPPKIDSFCMLTYANGSESTWVRLRMRTTQTNTRELGNKNSINFSFASLDPAQSFFT